MIVQVVPRSPLKGSFEGEIDLDIDMDIDVDVDIDSSLESQWPRIMGYFGSFVGYFRVEWPVVLGHLAFQVCFKGHVKVCHTCGQLGSPSRSSSARVGMFLVLPTETSAPPHVSETQDQGPGGAPGRYSTRRSLQTSCRR